MCHMIRNLASWLCVVGLATMSVSVVEAAPAVGPTAKTTAAKAKAKRAATAPTIPLTDEMVQQMAKASRLTTGVVRATVNFLRKYKPAEARQLNALLKQSPDRFRSAIRQANYELQNLESLKKSSPSRYKRRLQQLALQAKADLLVERYKTVNESEKPQVEVELTKLLAQLFDLRIEEERYELDQLRKQADQKAARIQERLSNKDRIVDREVTKLLGIDEVLVW